MTIPVRRHLGHVVRGDKVVMLNLLPLEEADWRL